MAREVRQATTGDAEGIHKTARASWHAAYDDVLGPETVDEIVDDWYALGDLESSIADASRRDDAMFLVVDADGEDAASAVLDRCRGFAHVVPWPEETSVAYLVRLYVDPDVWGEGTGTELLEFLENGLADRFDRIRLAVLADNRVGVSFYDGTGFECVETRESELANGLEEYVYEKPI
ncbi:GNAT family N-acetyltransferase [Natrarchaeobius chitinivorans]|uniref:GNAT family N-acetyltransferase n=1 Tax=Natrarchaeobius chitinivorans TaxID=1679083 RepID=A0A3N6MKR4_NATCH|nr:GNAT family N-acetyltransferase [Natrarchaeobius chitinivorans]RQG96561.1 GNAT family N-acetyltransferase [Natrarchaeobius chitinivorans]